MSEMRNQQPDQQGYYQQMQQPPANYPVKQSTSGLAIAGLILGILAIVTSFLPIINNGSFFLALVGIVLSIIGLVGISKGKSGGKGMAIAGIVLGVLSVVIVLVTQSMYSAALDKVSEDLKAGPTPTAATTSKDSAKQSKASQEAQAGGANNAGQAGDANQGKNEAEAKDDGWADVGSEAESKSEQSAGGDVDYQNLEVGTTIDMKDGLSLSVNSIEGGLEGYDGKEVVCVNVTYENNGTEKASFNPYDWKAEDPDGAERSQTFYMDGENQLDSGTLSTGGHVTGNIYFEGPVAKVHYYGNMFSNASTAAWVA